MYFDITTPENRLRAKKAYQKHLCNMLTAAIHICKQLNENDMDVALKAITKINRIRYQVYEKAAELDYVNKCINSIPICKGECCRWHFPKNLGLLDLFVTVCGSSSTDLAVLEEQIIFDNGKYQCPVLRENGCLLSFDNRPIACSNAYPCFSGELYHNYLERKKKEIDVQYMLLNKLFQKWTRGRKCDKCTS